MLTLSYLDGFLTKCGSKTIEVSTLVTKVREAYAGLKHFWHLSVFSQKLEGCVYGAVNSIVCLRDVELDL